MKFDQMVQQFCKYKNKLLDTILAYRALKSVNLREDNEKLKMATIRDIILDEKMIQMKKEMVGK